MYEEAGTKKIKKISRGWGGKKLDKWFDWECKVGRRNVRRLLKKYRRSLLADAVSYTHLTLPTMAVV